MFGHAQPVDVIEHTDAQAAQRLLCRAYQPVVGDSACEEDADRDHGRDEAGEEHELGAEPARIEHPAIEDDLDQDRDGELAHRGDDRERDRRFQTDAQFGARRHAAAEDVQRARPDPSRRRDVVVLDSSEDPLGELVARLGRRRVGDDVVRGTVKRVFARVAGLVAGPRHHATSWS